jgi:radical SAM superfamily enzyme YgiQ (UPF0313 family)
MIAMSGIRCCDAELLKKGLTLPGFVERSRTIASLPSLGLITLAGMTPREHEVSYFEIEDVAQAESVSMDFDLVAISSFSAQIGEAYALADRFRAAGVRVVLGGLHVTSMPAEAERHADAIVIGEGETAWPAVLRDAEQGTLKSRYSALDSEFDLSLAPMPAFHLLDIERYNRLIVQTSRGCPLRCEFCAASILLTRRYKQKRIESVLAEIDRICELWPRPFLEFADDNAFVNRSWWKAFLPELKKRRVKWFAETDVAVHEDLDLLAMMRESGCAQVLIGFESPVPSGLEGLEMRSDWKYKRRSQYVEAIRRIQSSGIRVNGCFILGLDGQTPEVFDAVFEFAEQTELFDVQITYQTPFPNTPLYLRLEREGRLLYPQAWERCTLFDLNFRPTPMTESELVQGFHSLTERLYSAEMTAWRKDRFAKAYRHTRSRHSRPSDN